MVMRESRQKFLTAQKKKLFVRKWSNHEQKKKHQMQRGFWTKIQHVRKSSGIHSKNENLKSDKRLSWMCLECDFGLFFGVSF